MEITIIFISLVILIMLIKLAYEYIKLDKKITHIKENFKHTDSYGRVWTVFEIDQSYITFYCWETNDNILALHNGDIDVLENLDKFLEFILEERKNV